MTRSSLSLATLAAVGLAWGIATVSAQSGEWKQKDTEWAWYTAPRQRIAR